MKTIFTVLEIEYTTEKPDAVELARRIERDLTTDKMRCFVRVLSEDREDGRDRAARD